jgi:hypothetical protein
MVPPERDDADGEDGDGHPSGRLSASTVEAMPTTRAPVTAGTG